MASYSYQVREVQNEGYISYEALDEQTGEAIPLKSPMVAGAYPEIEEHVGQKTDLRGKLVHAPSLGDEFDQPTQTWKFRRGATEVVVKDMPRTLIRVYGLRAPRPS
jgi:hypothetical protein